MSFFDFVIYLISRRNGMNIIIVGAGKVGELLCSDLSREGNDIILIEKNEARLNAVLANNDIRGIAGNGANPKILEDAISDGCDLFIAVTPEDEINIMASIMGKKLGAKYTIARVRNPEYSSHVNFMMQSLGVDKMINPELEAAKDISRSLKYPSAITVESFLNNKVTMVKLHITKYSRLVSIALKDLYKITSETKNLLVCIVERDDNVFIPNGDFIIQEGDFIYITGTTKSLTSFYTDVGGDTRKIESALIIGGSRIGYYLLKRLTQRKIATKIIERNEDRALNFAEEFPKTEVILGDGTDPDFLKEQRINNYDSLVCLTGIDEENILISLYAKTQGTIKTVTKVDRTSLLNIIGVVGLQTIVTPKKIIADEIIKTVRSKINKRGSQIDTLYRLSENRVEAIEFTVDANSKTIGVTLQELKTKPGIIIAYIYRNGEVIVPSGTDMLQLNDRVVVITMARFLESLDEILM